MYGRLFEKSEDGVIIGTPSGQVLRANDAACRMLGLTEARLVEAGRAGIAVDDVNSRTFVAERARNGFARGMVLMRRSKGDTFPVEVTSWILPVPRGDDFAYVVFRDVSALRTAEAVVEAQATELDAIRRASLDGYFVIGSDGRLVDVNDAACIMLGYSREEMAGLRLPDIEANEDPVATQAHMKRLRERGWDRFASRHRRKDGRVIDVEASVYFVPTAGGRFVSFVRDVSERLRAEESLRISEERHRLVLENASDVIFTLEPDGRISHVSPSVEKIVGFTVEEVVGRSQAEFLTPDSLHVATTYMSATIADCQAGRTPGDFHRELEYRTKGGARIWADVRALPMRRPDGSLAEFLGVVRDVSERKRAEEALRESERRYRALAEVSPNAVLTHRRGVVEYANPAAARLAGAETPEKMVGLQLLDLVHPDWRERERARTADVLAGKGVQTVELPVVVLDGSTRIVECALSAYADSDGPAVQVSLRDVTEERALQARLQVASRLVALGTLVSGVAHEVNNPLTGLTAGLGTAAEDLRSMRDAVARGARPGPADLLRHCEEMQESIDSAAESAERIARIVKDLAVFGGPTRQRARVRLAELVAAAVRWLPATSTALASVTVEDRGGPDVLVSRGQMEQVIVNLVANAANATPPGERGDVRVRLGPGSPGTARIEVADHGVGIAPAVLGRIFDPFFTTHPTGERRGTGLGLAICHAIVTAHDGTISVSSDVGKGSTFTVELPTATGDGPP